MAALDEMGMSRPAISHAIAELLGMADVPQTSQDGVRDYSECDGVP